MCLLMSGGNVPVTKYRKDYKPSAYRTEKTAMNFQLDAEETLVHSTLLFVKNEASKETAPQDLVLNGESIELVSVKLEGKELVKDKDFMLTDELLTINHSLLPQDKAFTIEIANKNFPRKNLELAGLYVSNTVLCTQCESQGFRRITYYLDRPDSVSKFTVRLEAEKEAYPVLLCNGNVISEEADLDNGKRHAKTFEDPFRKPAYLFAIVAGPLENIHDTYTTMATPEEPSKKVDLFVYAEPGSIEQAQWAMECQKKAMKWDEDTYGRVYDLNVFRMVCLHDFNMGAMENKSLVTFNSSVILSTKDTGSDFRFRQVCRVVGHEYFHNWSGNRVSVRDWFQITLKEGFTNFRDHSFCEDTFGRATMRIGDVNALRSAQFKEDAGPMAHSIRPEEYMVVDNFYTSTVYEKGSEVIGMYRTLVGKKGFRKGTDLYFSKYDGMAVSCDEFRGAIADANNIDLAQFENWYKQKGTPVLDVVSREFKKDESKYYITLKQTLPFNHDPQDKPFHMPILIGLIGKESKKDLLPTTHDIYEHTALCEMKEETHTFVFDNIKEDCVPSILRNFSAPVLLSPFLTDEETAFLTAYDTDPFNIYEATQTVLKKYLVERAADFASGKLVPDCDVSSAPGIPASIINGLKEVMKNRLNDLGFVSLCLQLPAVGSMEPLMKPYADPVALTHSINLAHKQIAAAMSTEFGSLFDKCYNESQTRGWDLSSESISRRSVVNLCLSYLVFCNEEYSGIALKMTKEGKCLTEKLGGVAALLRVLPSNSPLRQEAIDAFYNISKDDATMLDGWFSLQVGNSALSNGMDMIEKLAEHPDFKDTKNPNRFRSIVSHFMGLSHRHFHDMSGKGYEFAAKHLARFDGINGSVTAVVAKQLINFTRYSPERQALMKKQLEYLSTLQLSKGLREVVSNGLKN